MTNLDFFPFYGVRWENYDERSTDESNVRVDYGSSLALSLNPIVPYRFFDSFPLVHTISKLVNELYFLTNNIFLNYITYRQWRSKDLLKAKSQKTKKRLNFSFHRYL